MERGWTAFLRELAGESILDDLDKTKPEKVEMRKQFLRQLYAVAESEQHYLEDGLGMIPVEHSAW